MASFGDTQAAAFLNQVWDTEVLQARYGAAVIMPRILNRSSLVSESGQIIHIPVKPRFAGGDVGSAGEFTAEQQTITDVQVNVNTWKYVAVEVPDKTSKQSVVTLETELPNQFGERLAEFYDADIADLFVTLTGFDGTNPGVGLGTPGIGQTFDEGTALAAVLVMRRRNIKLEDLSWILPPEAYYLGWLTKERMNNANTAGLAKNNLITNMRQPILGIPGFESTLLNGTTSVDDASASLNPASTPNISGTSAAALIHTEAAAIAMQINNKYERFRVTPAGRLANGIVAHELYGLRAVRANHGLVMYIRNS